LQIFDRRKQFNCGALRQEPRNYLAYYGNSDILCAKYLENIPSLRGATLGWPNLICEKKNVGNILLHKAALVPTNNRCHHTKNGSDLTTFRGPKFWHNFFLHFFCKFNTYLAYQRKTRNLKQPLFLFTKFYFFTVYV